jgi:hypothetical protein
MGQWRFNFQSCKQERTQDLPPTAVLLGSRGVEMSVSLSLTRDQKTLAIAQGIYSRVCKVCNYIGSNDGP